MAALEKGITANGTGYGGKTWNILGQVYFPKAVTDSTFAFETNSEPGQFVPVHVHPTQEEFILVQEGMLDLKLDGVWVQAKAGDLVRLPRGIPHGYFNKSDKPARALFWVSPMQKLEALFNAAPQSDRPGRGGADLGAARGEFSAARGQRIASQPPGNCAGSHASSPRSCDRSLRETIVMVRQKHVCVIGAGVSGLAAAKAFARARTPGHDHRTQRRSRRRLGAVAVLSRRADAKPEGSLSLHRQGDAGFLSGMAEGTAGPRLSHRVREGP